MKNLIIVILTALLFSCASSNKVTTTNKQSQNNQIVENSNLVCKKTRKTGSRMNTRNCITKEQSDTERRESQEALRNATNAHDNIVPGAVGQ